MTPIHELRQNALEAIEQARPLRVRCADRHHTLSLVEEKSLSASRPDPAGRLACAPRYADATTTMIEGAPIGCGNATVGVWNAPVPPCTRQSRHPQLGGASVSAPGCEGPH